MDNLYLIYGIEDYIIDEAIKKIITDNNIIGDNIIKYNLDEVNVSLALEEASTVSMFDSKKLVICEGCTFLTGENKKEINHDIDSLTKYINNQFTDVFLVFVVRKEKLDDRKKIVKELKKNSTVIEAQKKENYNLNNYIIDYVNKNGYNMSKNACIKLIERAGSNLSNLISECDKIFLYKDDEKNITEEDIENLVFKNIEDNIFELTNAVMNKDKKKIINIYKDLILMGEEEIKLIVMLANQFRMILQVKLMVKNGYKERDMATIIKEHPYRVKLAMQSNFKINELENYLIKLEELDYSIKSGKLDKSFGFEMFLLNI